jgi:hypothetical protein
MSKRSEVEGLCDKTWEDGWISEPRLTKFRALLRAAERMRKEMPKEWQRSGDTTKLRAKIAYDRAKARILGE